jgi:hypothetical protein
MLYSSVQHFPVKHTKLVLFHSASAHPHPSRKFLVGTLEIYAEVSFITYSDVLKNLIMLVLKEEYKT